MNTHTVSYMAPQAISPRMRDWRKHPPAQVAEMRRQIQANGIVEPPLIDADNRVVCGSLTVIVSQQLKLESIPVLRLNHMSPEELRAYAITAAKIADMSEYDELVLAEEVRELEKLLSEEQFKLLAVAEGELTRLLELSGPVDEVPDPASLAADDTMPISRVGDIWQIGPHRLLVGNALEEASFAVLMAGELAQFALVDAPYNIPMKTISRNIDRDEFAFGHGEMSPNEFVRFLTSAMRNVKKYSEDGGLSGWFMSHHYLLELLRAGTVVFGRPLTLCTWIKSQAGQGGLFRSQTEQIAYFKSGDAPYRNNVNLGKHGRNRSTAWHFDGMNMPSAERDETLKFHATPKPVLMLKEAILDVTSRGGIVVDCFSGIGSTILAAHSAERRAFCIEIEPRFVDVAIRRMLTAHKLDAVREADGMSFSELERMRELKGLS